MIKLTWDDLIIEKPTAEPGVLFEDWRWLLSGKFRPIFWSKFGDCFIERESGIVELLDIVEGNLREVAPSVPRFHELIDTQAKQEDWLLSLVIWNLHNHGTIPATGQCYALKIHPTLGGTVEVDNVIIMDMAAWSSVSGQLYRQVQA